MQIKVLFGEVDIVKNSELYVGKNGCYEDHLGNYYSTIKTMCECWGVPRSTVESHIAEGWSLEKSLTCKGSKKVPDKDETVIWLFGEPFPNYNAIDVAYGFSLTTARRHRDDLEAWLKSKELFFIDGKLFRTYGALSREYKLSETTIRHRLRRNWTLSDAVHIPTSNKGRKGNVHRDHLGNTYENMSSMLLHYGLTYGCYYRRRDKGWDLCKILTTPMRHLMVCEPSKIPSKM